MKAVFAVGQRVRIITTCARVLNRGTIVGATDNSWIVRPDGCGRVRFRKDSLQQQPNPHRLKWPRIAHA